MRVDRIGHRLYLGFAVVIFFGGLAAGVTLIEINSMQRTTGRIANEFWPKALIANRIIDNVNNNGRAVLALMYLTDADEIKRSVGQMNEASKGLTGLYAQLDAMTTDETGKTLLKNIKKTRADYVASRKKVIDLDQAGKKDQALEGLMQETIPLQKRYLQSLYKLIEIQGNAMDDSVASVNGVGKRSIELVALLGSISFLAAVGMALLLNRSISRPLGRAVSIAQFVSEGLLNNEICIDSGGETGELLAALKLMQEKLSGIMREMQDCSLNMGQSALHIATVSKEIGDVNKEQEHRSGEVSAAMTQMHEISSSVQTQAIEAVDRSGQVETLAKDGIEKLRRNIDAMDETTLEVRRAATEIQELEESAQRINDIANTIQKIASQTNLLALNAAIEAARAGEEGRGFAVVAGEVRQLAVRTTNSAKEVNDIVEQVSGKIRQVNSTMNVAVKKVDVTQEGARNAAQIIEDIAGNAVITASVNQRISVASHQQHAQFIQLSGSLDTLKETLSENCLKVDDTVAIGHDLRDVATRLSKIMTSFTFDVEKRIEAVQNEHRNSPRAQNRLRVVLSQNEREIEAVTTDFSMSGAKLRTRRSLGKNARLAIALYQPYEDIDAYQRQEPLRLTGRIAWERQDGPTFQSGLEFDRFDNAKGLQMQRCFEYFGKNHTFQEDQQIEPTASSIAAD
jgi:methyl-accepting chemotaxis protein